MRIALLGVLVLLTTPALAEIYRYTDDRGNTVFTNQPPKGVDATTVDLPPPNTVDIKTPELPPALPDEQQADEPGYRSLRLSGIPDEQALRANNGTFTVTAQLDPPLQRGHRLRFLLDGEPQGEPSRSNSLRLEHVPRGEHELQVEVLSGQRVLQRSAPEYFTVQRVHTSSPALRRSSP